jgi:hypothetical protein
VDYWTAQRILRPWESVTSAEARRSPGESGVTPVAWSRHGDRRDYPRGYLMTTRITFDEALRILIREKLASGGLARTGIQGVSGGPGKGQICVACGTIIGKGRVVMEGIGSPLSDKKPVQFHDRCFQIWDLERRVPKS